MATRRLWPPRVVKPREGRALLAAGDSQSVASQLFAVSLFPYLGFLYFMTRSKTAPGLTLFGFYFLLVFSAPPISRQPWRPSSSASLRHLDAVLLALPNALKESTSSSSVAASHQQFFAYAKRMQYEMGNFERRLIDLRFGIMLAQFEKSCQLWRHNLFLVVSGFMDTIESLQSNGALQPARVVQPYNLKHYMQFTYWSGASKEMHPF